jgi:predicted SAM-dependent methyltransferase
MKANRLRAHGWLFVCRLWPGACGRWIRYRTSRRGGQIALDLGAGGPGRAETLGVDTHPGADVVWDLRLGLPWADGSVASIFSDHCLEHLALTDMFDVLRECHRVLHKGGQLRISVPHIDPYVSAWLKGDFAFLSEMISDVPGGEDDLYGTAFDRISWLLLRDGDHRAMFDAESIKHKLSLAGFGNVEQVQYEPAVDGPIRFSSIYLVARK